MTPAELRMMQEWWNSPSEMAGAEMANSRRGVTLGMMMIDLPDPQEMKEQGASPFEIAAARRDAYRVQREAGIVELEGDARPLDDDPDYVEDPETGVWKAEADAAHAAAEDTQEQVIATHHGFEIKIPEDLLVVHFVVSVPEGISAKTELLRRFQVEAQYLGYNPVLATAKEAKASDLANSGSELGAAARTLGVRGQERAGAVGDGRAYHSHAEGGGVPPASSGPEGGGGATAGQ